MNPIYKEKDFVKIAAIPVFFIPNPSENASIDPSLVTSLDVQSILEKNIINSFKKQSHVRGMSFVQVKETLKKINKSNVLKDAFQHFNERITDVSRHKLSSHFAKCYTAEDFVSFYIHCLSSQDSQWKDFLRHLSQFLYNADSLLLPVVTQLNVQYKDNKNTLLFQVNVLLIDVRNAQIIWSNQKTLLVELNNDSIQEFSNELSNALSENFWKKFPGRKMVK
jgi:hypothetical protein